VLGIQKEIYLNSTHEIETNSQEFERKRKLNKTVQEKLTRKTRLIEQEADKTRRRKGKKERNFLLRAFFLCRLLSCLRTISSGPLFSRLNLCPCLVLPKRERERELKTDSISYIVWRQGINTQKREKKKYLPLIFSTNCTTTANHSSVTIFRAKPTLTSPEEKASLDFQRSQLRYQEMMETAFSLTAVQDKCERREVTAPLETRG